MIARVLLAAIQVYQSTISRVLPVACRFQPTCSHYASDAIRQYGAIRGSWLALKRLVRCRPGGGSGFDPVP